MNSKIKGVVFPNDKNAKGRALWKEIIKSTEQLLLLLFSLLIHQIFKIRVLMIII